MRRRLCHVLEDISKSNDASLDMPTYKIFPVLHQPETRNELSTLFW